MTGKPPPDRTPDGADGDAGFEGENFEGQKFEGHDFEGQEFDDWGEPLPSPRRKTQSEESAKQAWGSWRQDRELNRRKVLRALVGLVVVSVLAGVFAYGCDILRGPPRLGLVEKVDDFTLAPPSSETEQLKGRLEAAGAQGPTAGRYVGPAGEVLIVAGLGQRLPQDVLSELLPAVTGGDLEYEGRGGPMTCGPTAQGSRCVWKGSDVVGGTAANLPPQELERLTRGLRAGAVRR